MPRVRNHVTTPQELLAERRARIAAAVALRTPDRVPFVPLGDAFAANQVGVSLAEFATDPDVAYPTIIKAFTALGEIDGVQHASYNVASLTTMWLSKVKWPGRDLPPDQLWQVEEAELMTPDDYDAIAADGYAAWLERFIPARRLGGGVRPLPGAFRPVAAGGVRGLGGGRHPGVRAGHVHHPLRDALWRAFHAAVRPRPAPHARPGRGGHAGHDAAHPGVDAPRHPRAGDVGRSSGRLALGERVPLAQAVGAVRLPLLPGTLRGHRGRGSHPRLPLRLQLEPRPRPASGSSPRPPACSRSTGRPTSSRPRRSWATTCA